MSNQTNGVATPTNGQKKPDTKPVTPVISIDAAIKELPPLDERLHRLNLLFELQKQHGACHKSLMKLQEFQQEGDQDTISFHLSDDDRHEFNTNNQRLNRAVLAFTQEWLKNEMQEIAAKIIL